MKTMTLPLLRTHIEQLVAERDHATSEAEGLHAGMREVALFRAANAQGCLGSYAVPLLEEAERLRGQVDRLSSALRAAGVSDHHVEQIRDGA